MLDTYDLVISPTPESLAAAQDPNTKPAMLLSLVPTHPVEVGANPALNLLSLSDPETWLCITGHVQEVLLLRQMAKRQVEGKWTDATVRRMLSRLWGHWRTDWDPKGKPDMELALLIEVSTGVEGPGYYPDLQFTVLADRKWRIEALLRKYQNRTKVGSTPEDALREAIATTYCSYLTGQHSEVLAKTLGCLRLEAHMLGENPFSLTVTELEHALKDLDDASVRASKGKRRLAP